MRLNSLLMHSRFSLNNGLAADIKRTSYFSRGFAAER
jgi:hypothetical protein